MNKITLRGIIKNIQYSHTINDIEFYKANLLVKRENGKEDLLDIKFKRFSNPYKENDEIELVGNVRTFNHKLEDRSKVEIFVFTYFDRPEEELQTDNKVEMDGKICKITPIRKTQSGKDVLDFVLANNLRLDNWTLNCYIPCVAWGKSAKTISKMNVGDYVNLEGQLQSREYKKRISDDDYEIRICHELNITEIK